MNKKGRLYVFSAPYIQQNYSIDPEKELPERVLAEIIAIEAAKDEEYEGGICPYVRYDSEIVVHPHGLNVINEQNDDHCEFAKASPGDFDV